MSYEGDLVASYDAVHKRLVNPPRAIKEHPPLVPPLPVPKNSLQAALLRIEALEQKVHELETRKVEVNPENIIINYPLYTQSLTGFLGEIFKLVRKNEQSLDPTTDLSAINLLGPSRCKKVTTVRQMIYYLMHTTTKKSLPEIGPDAADV